MSNAENLKVEISEKDWETVSEEEIKVLSGDVSVVIETSAVETSSKTIDRRPYKKVLSFVFWILLTLIVTFECITIIDKSTNYNLSLFGDRISVISSNSMPYVNEVKKERLNGINDRYYKGDYIISHEYKSLDDIKINDVITYFNGTQLVCHKVVNKVIKMEILCNNSR